MANRSPNQSNASPLSLRCSLFFYRILLYAYPATFRARFAQEMMQLFRDAHPGNRCRHMSGHIASLWFLALEDFAGSVPIIWWRELRATNDDDVPGWMIAVPVFALALLVIVVEGGVAAALTQRITFEALPNAPDPLTKINIVVSLALAGLAWLCVVLMARRRPLDFVFLKCSSAAESGAKEQAVVRHFPTGRRGRKLAIQS